MVVLTGAALSLGIGSAQAATVSFVGSVADNSGSEVTRWRTATTTKTFDSDGDGIYGTDGYSIFRGNQGGGNAAAWNTGITESQVTGLSLMQGATMPAGLSLVVGDTSISTDWDDPAGGTRNMGYAGPRDDGANSTVPLTKSFVYDVTGNIGASVRMGIAADGLGDGRLRLTNLRVAVGPNQADATLVANTFNGSPDMYFFDLGELQTGDQIEIWQELNLVGQTFIWPQINGVTFEVVPEPCSFFLSALGLLGLAVCGRPRKRQRPVQRPFPK